MRFIYLLLWLPFSLWAQIAPQPGQFYGIQQNETMPTQQNPAAAKKPAQPANPIITSYPGNVESGGIITSQPSAPPSSAPPSAQAMRAAPPLPPPRPPPPVPPIPNPPPLPKTLLNPSMPLWWRPHPYVMRPPSDQPPIPVEPGVIIPNRLRTPVSNWRNVPQYPFVPNRPHTYPWQPLQGTQSYYRYPQVPLQSVSEDAIQAFPNPQRNPPGPRVHQYPGVEETFYQYVLPTENEYIGP
jgi:hypothetical protein